MGVEHKAPRENGEVSQHRQGRHGAVGQQNGSYQDKKVVVKGTKKACKTAKPYFGFGDICIERCLSESESQRGEFGPVSFVSRDVLY